MRIDIITGVPHLLDSFFSFSIMKRAITKNILDLHIHDLHDYVNNKWRKIDDYAYGGEAGLVMQIEPIDKCLEYLKKQRNYQEIIYLTPDGELFNQQMANNLSMNQNMIFICGHYKGIDQRCRDYFITKEISIGDYVISGGELATCICIDAIVRLIPGVINDATSALNDSFQNNLLSHPVYSRPTNYKGLKVPDILLSGNEKKIQQWKLEKAIERTKLMRPEMLKDDD